MSIITFEEQRDQFIDRNGRRDMIQCVYDPNLDEVQFSGFLFPNGAWMTSDLMSLHDSPQDSMQNAKHRMLYCKYQLRTAIRQYEQLRGELNQRALVAFKHKSTPPDDDDLAPLLKLRDVVRQRQAALAAVETELEELVPQEVRQRQVAAQIREAENVTAADAFIEKLKALRI